MPSFDRSAEVDEGQAARDLDLVSDSVGAGRVLRHLDQPMRSLLAGLGTHGVSATEPCDSGEVR